MKKRIIIIGAGLGGLYIAKRLALQCDVILFEKRKREELGYPWCDAVRRSTFSDVELMLPEGICQPKKVLSLHAPSGEGKIKQPDRVRFSLDVDRKKLVEYFLKEISPFCDIRFETTVEKLFYVGESVRGVYADGRVILSDMVIDASGLFSPYRAATPDSFLMNEPLKHKDYLAAYRGYYKKSGGETPNNVYLYPGDVQIAWCKEGSTDMLDVFIADFVDVTDQRREETIAYLQKHNPCLINERIFSVRDYIPVRQPLGVLAANGYALVGNSAFMTRPFSGSGIEVTLKAAKYLADLLEKASFFSAEKLWKYSAWYMYRYGALFSAQYTFRQILEKLSKEDLDWLFSSGLFDQGIVAIATLDKQHIKDFKPRAAFNSIRTTGERKDLIGYVEGSLKQSAKAYFLAMTIPPKYDFEKIKKWKKRYNEFMADLQKI